MRLELFGAIALTTLTAIACDSEEEGTTLGQSTGNETGGSATAGAGGAVTGTGATSTTGNGGSSTGNGGSSTGNGGSSTGNGGSSTGNGGSSTGTGGAQGTAGAGGVGTVTCPTTAPTNGDTCTGRGNCTFGNTSCFCAGSRQGGDRTWRCFDVPDGGFGGFPGRDGGFTIPDGGFTQPTACTGAADCTGGNVCCSFQGGRGTFMFCASSAQCSQIGGTEVP